ncbi:tRNA lysidine(34) synthetase TilS [Herbaspirillum seropedicae]|uniref:tRNA lysidine(34) synthetase TilS n=1 Tax=Herbaspirillum seropedicae TaxID=964 RepID=UPI0028611C97|nr:tRNA lysidine(34) synthetase TilS [Herbaspirillum seropedicae]MDR6394813.1 tRNA(Ile)-lysidine synthase [Herbaspirillum seropedicae]
MSAQPRHARPTTLVLLQQALQDSLSASGFDAAHDTLAVAYSGGLDSTVLLWVAAQWARENGGTSRLAPLHVHHGLSPHADAWLAHAQACCAQLGLVLQSERVQLEGVADSGVEEAARLARYAALGRLCRQQGARVLLTAHHLDDQAETVLLQLLRGSGLAGLSGMDRCNTAPALLGDDRLLMARPFLGVTRAQLEAVADAMSLKWIEDESNSDPRYTRNALRHQVMPALGQVFPGYQQRLARAAGHAQGAQELLREVAEQDLAHCREDDHLRMPLLRALSEQRFLNLMRHWFGLRGMRMPSAAWMQEMRHQLLQADVEAQLCVSHPDGEVHRYRERVFLAPRRMPPDEGAVATLHWDGQAQWRLPAWYGTLHFDRIGGDDARPGFDLAWLQGKSLLACGRSGGERIRLAANRPARSLKQQYQSADVPAWERPYLPLVWAGESLLFAAGIGMDCGQFVQSATAQRIALRWQPD